jgi:hypothetical protein
LGVGNIRITYKLRKNIDIYLIIDIRKGRYKKYSFNQIWEHKTKNKKGLIIARVNDCDITKKNKTLEKEILKNIDKIDHYVFNSDFIKSYYLEKYPQFNQKPKTVIYNSSNSRFFYPVNNREFSHKKIKIVTHHWSDNINKGYEFYFKLHNYCKEVENLEFLFIGRKFNDGFIFNESNNLLVNGPYKDKELGDKIRECDLYVSASIYDSCPMHALEGLSCGLPILYINSPGGGRNICELSKQKVGEPFSDFDELLLKLNLILENYHDYSDNIHKNIDLYNSETCYSEYYTLFSKLKAQVT